MLGVVFTGLSGSEQAQFASYVGGLESVGRIAEAAELRRQFALNPYATYQRLFSVSGDATAQRARFFAGRSDSDRTYPAVAHFIRGIGAMSGPAFAAATTDGRGDLAGDAERRLRSDGIGRSR